jgi:group I intron endonuclease
MKKLSGIYRIRRFSNNDCYIGSAVTLSRRLWNHRGYLRGNVHPNKRLQAAWNKYGEASFGFEILLICAPNDLLFYEQRAIDIIKPKYNNSPNANSNLGISFPTMKGRKRDPEICAKISASHKGVALSESHRRSISAAKKGRMPHPGFRRPGGSRPASEYDGRRGRKRNPESIMKSADARRGKKRTAEQRQRMSEAALRMPPEVRKRIDYIRTIVLRKNGWLPDRRARFVEQRQTRYREGWSPWKAHRQNYAILVFFFALLFYVNRTQSF